MAIPPWRKEFLLVAWLSLSGAWISPTKRVPVLAPASLKAIRIPFLERKERSREQVSD
jgi:hypothetical protein